MEYCSCGSLSDFIKKNNGLSEEELRDIAACCLLGLKSIRAHHIVHGVLQFHFLFP